MADDVAKLLAEIIFEANTSGITKAEKKLKQLEKVTKESDVKISAGQQKQMKELRQFIETERQARARVRDLNKELKAQKAIGADKSGVDKLTRELDVAKKYQAAIKDVNAARLKAIGPKTGKPLPPPKMGPIVDKKQLAREIGEAKTQVKELDEILNMENVLFPKGLNTKAADLTGMVGDYKGLKQMVREKTATEREVLEARKRGEHHLDAEQFSQDDSVFDNPDVGHGDDTQLHTSNKTQEEYDKRHPDSYKGHEVHDDRITPEDWKRPTWKSKDDVYSELMIEGPKLQSIQKYFDAGKQRKKVLDSQKDYVEYLQAVLKEFDEPGYLEQWLQQRRDARGEQKAKKARFQDSSKGQEREKAKVALSKIKASEAREYKKAKGITTSGEAPWAKLGLTTMLKSGELDDLGVDNGPRVDILTSDYHDSDHFPDKLRSPPPHRTVKSHAKVEMEQMEAVASELNDAFIETLIEEFVTETPKAIEKATPKATPKVEAKAIREDIDKQVDGVVDTYVEGLVEDIVKGEKKRKVMPKAVDVKPDVDKFVDERIPAMSAAAEPVPVDNTPTVSPVVDTTPPVVHTPMPTVEEVRPDVDKFVDERIPSMAAAAEPVEKAKFNIDDDIERMFTKKPNKQSTPMSREAMAAQLDALIKRTAEKFAQNEPTVGLETPDDDYIEELIDKEMPKVRTRKTTPRPGSRSVEEPPIEVPQNGGPKGAPYAQNWMGMYGKKQLPKKVQPIIAFDSILSGMAGAIGDQEELKDLIRRIDNAKDVLKGVEFVGEDVTPTVDEGPTREERLAKRKESLESIDLSDDMFGDIDDMVDGKKEAYHKEKPDRPGVWEPYMKPTRELSNREQMLKDFEALSEEADIQLQNALDRQRRGVGSKYAVDKAASRVMNITGAVERIKSGKGVWLDNKMVNPDEYTSDMLAEAQDRDKYDATPERERREKIQNLPPDLALLASKRKMTIEGAENVARKRMLLPAENVAPEQSMGQKAMGILQGLGEKLTNAFATQKVTMGGEFDTEADMEEWINKLNEFGGVEEVTRKPKEVKTATPDGPSTQTRFVGTVTMSKTTQELLKQKDALRLVNEDVKAQGKAYSTTEKVSTKYAGGLKKNFNQIGEKFRALSWKFTMMSMGALGVFFSMMSFATLLRGAFGSIMGPLANLEQTFGQLGMAVGLEDLSKIKLDGVSPAENILQDPTGFIEAWATIQYLIGQVTGALANLGIQLLQDPEFVTSLKDGFQGLIDAMSTPEFMDSIKSLAKSFVELLPQLVELVPWVAEFFTILTTNFPLIGPLLPWLVKLALVAAALMPVFSAVSMVAGLMGIAFQVGGWILATLLVPALEALAAALGITVGAAAIVVVAILAVIAVIILALDYFGFLDDVVNGLITVFQGFLGILTLVLTMLADIAQSLADLPLIGGFFQSSADWNRMLAGYSGGGIGWLEGLKWQDKNTGETPFATGAGNTTRKDVTVNQNIYGTSDPQRTADLANEELMKSLNTSIH